MKATQETLRMAGRLLSLHSDELPVEFVEKLERLRASGQYELMEEREATRRNRDPEPSQRDREGTWCLLDLKGERK